MATVAIDGSLNAALLAVMILATDDARVHIRKRLRDYLANQTESVTQKAERMERLGFDAYGSIDSKGM